jgi:hypothetical protein
MRDLITLVVSMLKTSSSNLPLFVEEENMEILGFRGSGCMSSFLSAYPLRCSFLGLVSVFLVPAPPFTSLGGIRGCGYHLIQKVWGAGL